MVTPAEHVVNCTQEGSSEQLWTTPPGLETRPFRLPPVVTSVLLGLVSDALPALGCGPMPVHAIAGGVRITVRVQPRASRESVIGIHEDALKITLTAPPVDGEANAALVAFLASSLGVAKKQVRVVRGERSKTKLVEIAGVSVEAVRRWMQGG
jgi:hypothetical protein